ncbi:hypothetical protein [Microvirga pakistanensis]|uniref:hypothetical protein n=1 Tax=Microvirga pakistanensis TaxID=1682650 RepID=UPI00106CFFD3|nr:hypothetical protein [Microvirga pakistanensis]
MNFAFGKRGKVGDTKPPGAVETCDPRPGLPVSLATHQKSQGTEAASARNLARRAAEAREHDPRERRGDRGKAAGSASGGIAESETRSSEAAKTETGEQSAARTEASGTDEAAAAAARPEGASVTSTPVSQGRTRLPDVFRSVGAPALPPTPIPDLSRIRSLVVPPPPASAVRRTSEILRATGSTPAGHHAQIQRALDSVADRARAAERNVIFQVGGIAADARHSIEALAQRIPSIVGGGVARIKATAAAVVADINAHADAQIQAVLNHKYKDKAGLAERGKDTEVSMHKMLMQEAPRVLKDAKAAMDAEVDGLAAEAGNRIDRIKSGTKPAAMDTGVAPDPSAKPADMAIPDSGKDGEQYTTWPAAREALTNKLMTDLPANRTAQYGNLQCAAAVPMMVEAQQRGYEAANAETIKELTSEETKTRFFDITFGLIMPTVREEQEKADPVADESYTGHLSLNLSLQYSMLDGATRRIVRQIDEKRGVLVDETLDPSVEKSLPAHSIKGVREAGKKMMDGLNDQARVVEASLKANLAALAAHYPDLVKRLEPMIASGEFLEATATLAQLAEAEKSIAALEGGQIESVAQQAMTTLANARKGFDQQVASLYKMTGSSVDSLLQTLARARYDFARTTMLYTGTMDRGVAAVFPQIHAHAAQVADRLLGPKNNSRQQFSNIKTAAIGYINGVISAEWAGYLARVNGMEKGFGGVADASWKQGDSGSEFNRIRNGAAQDAGARGHDVESALTPAPMTTGERVGGYMFLGLGALAWDIYSDPNESKVTTALSIPWPGPNAVDEQHKANSGRGVIQLIEERMKSEEEQADILKLFNPDQNVRASGKAGLLEGSSASTGINAEAALALSQSLTADELASPIMTPERRQRIAEELRSTLKPANMEVAAAYLNGEPDQALAIRMRQLFDKQASKQEKDQLQTGEELDRLIRQELFASGPNAYVPNERLEAMRNAAFLRFDEISREGRQPVTVRNAPVAPPPDRLALTPAQLRYEGRPLPPPQPRIEASGRTAAPPARTAPVQKPAARTPPAPSPAPAPARAVTGPEASNEKLAPEKVATDQTRKLDEARRAIVAYMNKPHASYFRQPNDRFAEEDMKRFSEMDRKVRTYDPATGRVTIAPALAIQAYNTAIIMHGTNSPEAMGARAAAAYSRISGDSSLSTNQVNELNQNFSNMEYARFRARWESATPAQRAAMAKQWEDIQARHRTFLRETARGMGMEGDLDDPIAVEAFVSQRLGAQFAKEGEEFRKAGTEITKQGRMAIDTGVALAADGLGTNEALMQSVLANRTHAEFNVRRANGETMHDYAYRVADNEMSGDDWHQAKEKLRGEDENEFERYETLRFLKDQQLKEGTGWLGRSVMADAWQKRHLENTETEADNRLRTATRAGIEDYNKRVEAAGRRDLKIDPASDDMPVRLPGGQLNPLVQRFAVNGDGKLRGNGPSMDVLQANTRQAADFYQQEVDRNESIFTSLITALAVAVSVLLLFIPGINLIAAGILVALISGAATVAVKSGMRGGRYGWEEMATDIGMTAIEAATAGIGGAMSKGATAAANAARTGQKIGKLGTFGRVGAGLHTRLGPVAAPIVQGGITGAASTAATAALDDKLWDDGIGTGIGRVLGHSVKGGLSGAANAAVTGAITRGLDRRLAPTAVGRNASTDRLNRIGKSLGPGGREFLTEVLANTPGSLVGETINILADVAMDKHVGGWSGAFERLGKAGVRELASVAGRTKAQQIQRAQYNRMSADIHGQKRNPNPREARILNWLGQNGSVIPLGTRTDEFARGFSNVRARIDELPPQIRDEVAKMGPNKAMDVIRMMDSGQLGNRAQRLQFTMQLGKEIVGLDVEAFDRAMQSSSRDFARNRHARKELKAQTNKQLLSAIRGPERAHLQELDFSDLISLPPATKARLATALAEGGADLRALVQRMIPEDPHLAARVAARMVDADAAVTRARNAVATRRAGIRDDLMEAAPEASRGRIAGLRPREAEALHAALREGEPTGFARASAILRGAGLDRESANKVARSMMSRIMRAASRVANLDNVPPPHIRAMLDLRDDALMEIRVAQFTRRPLSDARVDEIVAATAARRPGIDRQALLAAIRATMATRHGRPGFREALTQKRALLDMIPFGMKRVVYRTPVITLPEDSFLAYVRGKGNEHAVTLIVNGNPVILMRQGSNPKVLTEEGLHVLQYRDPRFRERVATLGEEHMARWDDLDLDTQVRAYRAKIDVEIDGQQRMIGKLRARANNAFFEDMRNQALKQLQAAEETLTRLITRRGEANALTPAELDAIAAGIVDPPGWLRQPARMFSKSAADQDLFEEIEAAARTPLRDAFRALTSRVPEMSKGNRRQLVQTIHALAEVVPADELVRYLGRIRSGQPLTGDEDLAKIPPERIAVTVRNHFLAVGDPSQAGSIARRVLDRVTAKRGLEDKDLKLVRATLKRLTRAEPGDLHPELEFAKRALVLALHRLPDNTPDAAVMDRFRSAAKVLGISPTRQLKGLANKPEIQAAILEALAGPRPPAVQDAYFKSVNEMLNASATLPRAMQHMAFRLLTQAYFENTPVETFERIIHLVHASGETLGPPTLLFVSQHPHRITELLPKMSGLMSSAVDPQAKPPSTNAAAGKVTVQDMLTYCHAALLDPELRNSLIRMGSRAMSNGKLSASDLDAIRKGEPIAVGQEPFLARFADPLEDAEDWGAYKPIVIKREQAAQDLVKAAKGLSATGASVISIEEARSIVQRLEVLEASVAFSTLTGASRSRSDLMNDFLQRVTKLPQGTTEVDRNRRGTIIEEEFRRFVRVQAETVITSIAAGVELPGPNGTRLTLSQEARIGLINRLIRGVNDVKNPVAVNEAVQQEIDHALSVMREAYLRAARTTQDTESLAKLEAGFDSLVRRGLVEAEPTAKGKMQENLIEVLLKLKSDPTKPGEVPQIFDDVSSATFKAQRNFHSIDQEDAAKVATSQNKSAPSRSTDHVLKVETDKNLPPGMSKGDLIQTDSKAGAGAFDPDQFKRYFVEMARMVAGDRTVDPDGGLFARSGAKSVAYITDNHENLLRTQRKVMAVLEEMLSDPKADRLVIRIENENFDLTQRYGITPDSIRKNADKFIVHFGRIAQASDAHLDTNAPEGRTSSHSLGPFLFQRFATDVAAMIRNLLDERSAINRAKSSP